MSPLTSELLCPPFSHCVDWPQSADAWAACESLPNAPGVVALCADADEPLCLVTTRDIRRLVRSRLKPAAASDLPTRRVDYAALTRSVRAVTVSSAFEADWAYLQLARRLLPATYRSMFDHWRGWFIHCNGDAEFPRFQKTPTPGKAPTGRAGIYFGPIADKHAAARYMDMLNDAFDLCRYYHILIESPNGRACAYKEMGRCPAPCDGTISMAAYRAQIRHAVRFACDPAGAVRTELECAMREAAEARDFEQAARLNRILQALEPAAKPEFRWVRDLRDFRFVLVSPAERIGWARLWIVNGGWVEPICDAPVDSHKEAIKTIAETLLNRMATVRTDMSDDHIENIGLMCRHLFMAKSKRPRTAMIAFNGEIDAAELRRAVKRTRGDLDDEVGEQELSVEPSV